MSKKPIKAYLEVKNNELFYYPPGERTDKLSHRLKIEGRPRLLNGNLVFDIDESYNLKYLIGYSGN